MKTDLDAIGAFPTTYRFKEHRTITVEWRDGRDRHDLWAVVDCGLCFNNRGEWEYEPLPSSRTDEFLERCRFPLDVALAAAHAIISSEKLHAYLADHPLEVEDGKA